jgi:hypothetical protein
MWFRVSLVCALLRHSSACSELAETSHCSQLQTRLSDWCLVLVDAPSGAAFLECEWFGTCTLHVSVVCDGAQVVVRVCRLGWDGMCFDELRSLAGIHKSIWLGDI